MDYAIEFRTLAADRGWNNSALIDTFLSSLSHKIKDHLISLDIPEDLDSVIALTHKLEEFKTERKRRFSL